MAKHCLVVTYLDLTNLREKAQGTYRRLSMLLASVQRAGLAMRILCLGSLEQSVNVSKLSTRIEAELKDFWGINASVMIMSTRGPSTLPWVAQQFFTAITYTATPSIRALSTPTTIELLKAELSLAPAIVFVHRLPAMQIIRNARSSNLPPIIFDLDDVEHVVAKEIAKRSTTWRNKFFGYLSIPAVARAERAAIRTASKTLVCSANDANRVREIAPYREVQVVVNTVERPAGSPVPVAQTEIILMVGIFSYGPNADGANYFISEVWPCIQQRFPQVKLMLAGKDPQSIPAFSSPPTGVHFLGFVPDLDSLYREARVVICPIRYGSGTRIKLVEAAVWGKPIVSTTLGAEGLGMKHEKELLLADTAGAFAEGCISLLTDDNLCAKLGVSARTLAANQFDRNAVTERLASSIKKLVDPSVELAVID